MHIEENTVMKRTVCVFYENIWLLLHYLASIHAPFVLRDFVEYSSGRKVFLDAQEEGQQEETGAVNGQQKSHKGSVAF